MSSPEAQVVASVIAAATALVAVILGPFISFNASKRQMLGPMRQTWINSLRDTIAEYTAKIGMGVPQPSALLASDDDLRHKAQSERMEHLQTVLQLKAKIALLINPKEVDHQEIVRLTEVTFKAYEEGRDTTSQLAALIAHAQQVLKREWNVIKA